jgi:hypothetical protein
MATPKRDDWIDLARKLDWDYSYVREEDLFPEILSGRPWLPHAEWQHCIACPTGHLQLCKRRNRTI